MTYAPISSAFRFFTPAARPLNRLQPARESVPAQEQRGCLHANMDLVQMGVQTRAVHAVRAGGGLFPRWPAGSARWICGRAPTTPNGALGFDPIAVIRDSRRPGREYEKRQRELRGRGRTAAGEYR